jgi:hypothetical protein
MALEKVVSITGFSSLFHVIANKGAGLIVEDLSTGQKQFISNRKNQFLPLATIGIYTDTDTVELTNVLQSMKAKLSELVLPETSNAEELRSYFEQILPEYDRERFQLTDMKKVVRWFGILDKKNLVPVKEVEKVEVSEKAEVKAEAKKEVKKEATKKTKKVD